MAFRGASTNAIARREEGHGSRSSNVSAKHGRKMERRIGRQRVDEGDVPSTQFYEEIKFVAAAPYLRPGRGERFPSGLLGRGPIQEPKGLSRNKRCDSSQRRARLHSACSRSSA